MIRYVYGILGVLEEHRKRIRRSDIRRFEIFGAFTPGKGRKESDIDIRVRFTRKESLFRLFGLRASLPGLCA